MLELSDLIFTCPCTQVRELAASEGVVLAGENALPCFSPNGVDAVALERIVYNTQVRNPSHRCRADEGLVIARKREGCRPLLRKREGCRLQAAAALRGQIIHSCMAGRRRHERYWSVPRRASSPGLA